MDIYRNIHTFSFKLLQECTSWASRNGAVQMFFVTPNRNIFAGTLWENIIFNIKSVEIHKLSEVFSAKLYCKMNDPSWWFLLAFRLFARKFGVKKNSDDVHWNVWTNVKKLYTRNNIFKKRIQNIFWSIFRFLGTALGVLANAFY